MATGTGWQPPYSAAPSISSSPAAAAASGSGTSPSSTSSHLLYESALTMEYTQDLHLKMSKKIAQLTKVIYALNTKNDEHEDAIKSLKEAHDEEVQHILTEAREKILHYKSKIGDEADLKRRLQSLEESVELHEHMKRQALAEFEMYRQRVEDTQLCTEAQHTQRVVSMSREVEDMRHEFDEKLRSFSQMQAQFEQEKRRVLEELKSVHRQEVQELLESQQNQSASSSLEQEKLAELHRTELESLMERVEELMQDKVRLVEEYDAKLSKAQGFYERELEAMRRTQQLTTENLLAWKRTEVELRKEFQVQESALQRTLCKLRMLSKNINASQKSNFSYFQELHKQLEEAIQDGEIWVMQLKDTEYELEGSRDRVQQQANEILHKASQIGSLQATQMSHEATIRDLGSEQNRLKEKILQLEEERERLQKQIQTLEEQQHQKVLSLEKSLCEEKQNYEMELARIRAKYEEEMACLKECQAESLEELKEKHRVQQEGARSAAEREKNQLLSEMRQQFDIRRLSLEEQRNHLQQQLETTREELTTKLNMANQEVSHLKDLVKESEKNLDTAENHISCLKDSQEKLLIELDATRARVRETSNLLTDIQEEIETQKQQHEAKVIAIKTEEKQKMDKITKELDLKWTDALRCCTKLMSHGSVFCRSLMNLFSVFLLCQISLLKQSLELQMSQSKSALQQLQAQFSQEREHLAQQLQELVLEHQHRECHLQEAHCCAMQDMEEAQQIELGELEERLKQEQREELHALSEAHRQTLEILQQQSDQELQTLRFELEDEGKAMLASLRSELNHLHATAIEHLRQVHFKENNAAKRELDDTIDRCKEHVNLLGRISGLRQEVSCRKNRIADLDHEIHSLNETISILTKELELKGKEVLRVRSEANLHIRAHGQDLSKRLEREIDELNASHNRETQIMLSDFNKAQELLKDKISALQILLEGTEEKFRNRESRQEDLQVIAELREIVSEREALVKKLVDDKKFYQLELVNREPGFNKVFNTNPNVGVINPLIKHKSRKPANSFASSPNLSVVAVEGMAGGLVPPACLESVPNSPIHHHELRSNNPPPPPTPPPQADSTWR
uniref:Protein FAM184A-like n=1 Tax=Sinocyclocheilus anshuiensis TaxID=1608454 RepID=A0A671STV8_9TELE